MVKQEIPVEAANCRADTVNPALQTTAPTEGRKKAAGHNFLDSEIADGLTVQFALQRNYAASLLGHDIDPLVP